MYEEDLRAILLADSGEDAANALRESNTDWDDATSVYLLNLFFALQGRFTPDERQIDVSESIFEVGIDGRDETVVLLTIDAGVASLEGLPLPDDRPYAGAFPPLCLVALDNGEVNIRSAAAFDACIDTAAATP